MPVTQIQKPVYQTSDGKQFEDETEAEKHEVTALVDKHADSFFTVSGYAPKFKQLIVAWELHKEGLLQPRKAAVPEPEPATA